MSPENPSSPLVDQPLISVIMPVYNAESFVGDAIESILQQTYSRLELIIVDDGSADRSWAVIQSEAQRDARIRPIRITHGGTSVALNVGIAAAVGQYIALMDADDLALPERLAVQQHYLEHAEADVCGACVQTLGNENKVLWFPESDAAIRFELLFRCALLPSSVLMRAVIAKANPYLPGAIFQDYEMWTRLAMQHRLANCPQVLVRYRFHPQQISRTQKNRNQVEMAIYRRRYFFALFPETEPEEFAALERLILRQAHLALWDLEAAGLWLRRFSDVPDALFQKRLAERWLEACSRAAGLGPNCFTLYRRLTPNSRAIRSYSVTKLYLRCLLRLAAGSQAEMPHKKLSSACFF